MGAVGTGPPLCACAGAVGAGNSSSGATVVAGVGESVRVGGVAGAAAALLPPVLGLATGSGE